MLPLRTCLLGSIVALSLLAGHPARSQDIDQQLDIQPYNATQGQARDVADRWLQLADEKRTAAEYEEALAAWSEAAEIYSALGDYESLGRTYDYMGITLARLGRQQQAEQLLQRRVAIARDNRQFAGEVYGLNNLGTLQLQSGDLESAQATFTNALEVASAIDHDGGLGLSLSNLGLVATMQGNLSEALEYYEAATGYRYAAGDRLGEAHSSNNLGDVYRRLGRDGNAIGAYRIALKTAIDLDNRTVQLRAIDGLYQIYLERQDWRNVERLLDSRSALTLAEAPADVQTVLTLIYMGDYYRALGDVDQARDTYRRALALARDVDASRQAQQLVNRLIRLD